MPTVTRKTSANRIDSERVVVSNANAGLPAKSQRLILMNGTSELSNCTTFHLEYPISNRNTIMLADGGQVVYEMLHFKNDLHRSWLVSDQIISDGSFVMASVIHPLFLYVDRLIVISEFVQLSQIVDSGNRNFDRLLCSNCSLLTSMKIVCDFKDLGDEMVYRYKEDKLFDWLLKRLVCLERSLDANDVYVSKNDTDSGALRRYAFGVLCDYLPEKIMAKFKDYAKISDPVTTDADSSEFTSSQKRVKTDEPTEDYFNLKSTVPSKQKEPSTKQKQLQAASKGTKSLSSFFKKS